MNPTPGPPGPPNTIRIKVRTLRPSTHELTVDAQLPIAELKERLVELTGVLHERQRLLFSGHALQDGTLWSCGVRDGHTIHLVERPEGAAGAPPLMPQPAGGVSTGAMPAQQASGNGANAMADSLSWLGQLMGGIAGLGAQGMPQGMDGQPAAQGNPPVSINVTTAGGAQQPANMFGGGTGGLFGLGPALGQPPISGVQLHQQVQQAAAAAQQQPPPQATALLSTVQNFITHMSSQHPAAAQPPPATVPYVLPEGRRQDSERRWFTAAQAVLEDANLRPEVRRFVETSVASSLAAPAAAQARHPPGESAGPTAALQQAGQAQDHRLATTVAVAVGELLRQAGELWRDRSADVLTTANTALSRLSRPIRPGQASVAIAQLQLANAQLFAVGALAWELSRLCSMLLPALSGTAALPLATGRSAFINAAGTAPIMPLRAPIGLAGANAMGLYGLGGLGGLGAAPPTQPQGTTPVTVRLPNGSTATGHFAGEAPREEDFMQQLQYILGGQFGIPRPGEGPPPPPPAVAAGSGSQRPGRRAPGAAAGHRHGVGQADEMPDLVDDASMTEGDSEAEQDDSEYESEWEDVDEDEDIAAAATAAGPQYQEQGSQTAQTGLGPRSPSITITFGNSPQMDMGGGWPFPSIAADSVPGAPPTGGAAAAANSWQTLLANPQLDAVQQELGRLVSTVVMPIVSELISQPQVGAHSAAAGTDFVQNLSQRIASALQPSMATIQRVVQMVSPAMQAATGGNAAATQPRAPGAAGGAAVGRPAAQPAAAGTTSQNASEGGEAAAADGEQQWAYVPTTTMSAEITVEPVDAAGNAADPRAAGGQSNVMAALSASMPLIQQALAEAMRPQQHGSAPESGSAGTGVGEGTSQQPGQPSATTAMPAASAEQTPSASAGAEARAGVGVNNAAAGSVSGGGSSSQGVGSAAAPPAASGRGLAAATPQPGIPSGIGGGLGLPPRPGAARRGGSAGRRTSTNGPAGLPASAVPPATGTAPQPTGQLGIMLASMLGGGGASGSAGATGGSGNFAQMLGQIASSPAMHQLAASPTLQNAVQPLLDGGSGGQGAGQMDFGALMNEMGSVLAQMMGGGAGGLLGAASGNPTAAPAAPAPVDVPARPRSTPLPTAQAGAAGQQHEVDPAVERVVGEELPAEDAEQWLSTMRADAQVMQQQGAEQRPLSSSYTAGSLHPPSSSDRLF